MFLPEVVRNYASERFVAALAGALGEPVQRVSAATSAAIPALLSLYVNEVADPAGADEVYETLHNRGPSVLSDLPQSLVGNDSYALIEEGAAQFKRIFGRDSADGLAHAISGFSGLGISSSRSVVGIVNTMVIATLSRHSAAENGRELAAFLRDNRAAIAGAIPAGLHEYLNVTPKVRSAVHQHDEGMAATGTDDEMHDESEIPRQENAHNNRYYELDHNDADRFAALAWVVPLIMVLVVGAALMYVLAPQRPSLVPPLAQNILSTPEDAAQPAGATLIPQASSLKALNLRGDPTLGQDLGESVDRLKASLVQGSGNGNIPALEQTRDDIGNITARVQKLPPDEQRLVAATLRNNLTQLKSSASAVEDPTRKELLTEIMGKLQVIAEPQMVR